MKITVAILIAFTIIWGLGAKVAVTHDSKEQAEYQAKCERIKKLKAMPDIPGVNCINFDAIETIIILHDDNLGIYPKIAKATNI